MKKLTKFRFFIHPVISFLGAVVPGAGAFEIGAYCMLKKEAEKVKGRVKLGVLVRNFDRRYSSKIDFQQDFELKK
jgi:hypothetical protein